MRTANEKTKDAINNLKRHMARIYRNQIEPLTDYFDENYRDTMLSEDYRRFFKRNQSFLYNNVNQFDLDLIKCFDVYHDKVGGDELLNSLRNLSPYEYDIEEAKSDYELMEKVGKESVEVLKYMKQCRSARTLVESRKEINKRKNDMDERIEHAHTYAHNLRPPMSQGRLYGDKIRTPRKKTSTKTKFVCPEKMF